MESRESWVDYAKAIGIVLVVYGHVARGLHGSGMAVSEDLYTLADSIVYSFHMPLFFFLSGLFFYSSFSRRGSKKLVFNKIDTILYPYVIWSIFQGTIEAFLSEHTNGNASYGEVISVFWEPRAQFWFLYALFFAFFSASIIYYKTPKKYSFLIFTLATAMYLLPAGLIDIHIYRLLAENLVFFFFGVIFTMYFNVSILSSGLSLLLALVIFLTGQLLFHGYLSLNYTDKGIASLLLALTSITFVVSLSVYLSKKSYFFIAFIGTSSMAIYLMHILAGSGTRVLLNKLFHVDSFSVHLLLGCLTGVLAPLVMLALIKKMKVPYVFSAPVSSWLISSYNKAWQRIRC